MKTKFKKYGALAIAALCTVLLVLSGCNNVFGPDFEDFGSAGKVTLRINGGLGRTIQPDLSTTDFTKMSVEIFKGDQKVAGDDFDYSDIGDIEFEDIAKGSYKAVVKLYTDVLVAEGSTDFTVANTAVTVDIDLIPVAGNGAFEFDITNLIIDDGTNATVTEITMVITKGAEIVETLELKGGAAPVGLTGNEVLPSGIYTVTITFNNGSATREWVESLHVYTGLKSKFAPDVKLDLFSAATVKDAAIAKAIQIITGYAVNLDGLNFNLLALAGIDASIADDIDELKDAIVFVITDTTTYGTIVAPTTEATLIALFEAVTEYIHNKHIWAAFDDIMGMIDDFIASNNIADLAITPADLRHLDYEDEYLDEDFIEFMIVELGALVLDASYDPPTSPAELIDLIDDAFALALPKFAIADIVKLIVAKEFSKLTSEEFEAAGLDGMIEDVELAIFIEALEIVAASAGTINATTLVSNLIPAAVAMAEAFEGLIEDLFIATTQKEDFAEGDFAAAGIVGVTSANVEAIAEELLARVEAEQIAASGMGIKKLNAMVAGIIRADASLGDLDWKLNRDFTAAATGTNRFSLADWIVGKGDPEEDGLIAGHLPAPFQRSGSAIVHAVNGGLNITNRPQDHHTVDLMLIAYGLTPATENYRVTVYGITLGGTSTSRNFQLQMGESPWTVYASQTAAADTDASFKFVWEIGPTTFAIPAQTRVGSGNTLNFRITLIEIEKTGDKDLTPRTVTFDLGYGGGDPAPPGNVVIQNGLSLGTQLPTVTRDDHVFRGWFKDIGQPTETQILATTPITADLDLTAKWDEAVEPIFETAAGNTLFTARESAFTFNYDDKDWFVMHSNNLDFANQDESWYAPDLEGTFSVIPEVTNGSTSRISRQLHADHARYDYVTVVYDLVSISTVDGTRGVILRKSQGGTGGTDIGGPFNDINEANNDGSALTNSSPWLNSGNDRKLTVKTSKFADGGGFIAIAKNGAGHAHLLRITQVIYHNGITVPTQ